MIERAAVADIGPGLIEQQQDLELDELLFAVDEANNTRARRSGSSNAEPVSETNGAEVSALDTDKLEATLVDVAVAPWDDGSDRAANAAVFCAGEIATPTDDAKGLVNDGVEA